MCDNGVLVQTDLTDAIYYELIGIINAILNYVLPA